MKRNMILFSLSAGLLIGFANPAQACRKHEPSCIVNCTHAYPGSDWKSVGLRGLCVLGTTHDPVSGIDTIDDANPQGSQHDNLAGPMAP